MLLVLFKIKCAVLILEGSDSLNLEENGHKTCLEELNVICQHAKFKMWKTLQGGHYLHLDNPEQTAQQIKQFFVLCGSQDLNLHTSKL